MTILSKDALQKIKEERAILNEEDSADIDELFKKTEEEQRQKPREDKLGDELDLFEEGGFNAFSPPEK